jgi:hypothetical protein
MAQRKQQQKSYAFSADSTRSGGAQLEAEPVPEAEPVKGTIPPLATPQAPAPAATGVTPEAVHAYNQARRLIRTVRRVAARSVRDEHAEQGKSATAATATAEALTAHQPAARPLVVKPTVIAGAKSGPRPASARARSKASRVVVVVGMVAVLAAALGIVAPLGGGGGLAGAFQAYANVLPWSAPQPTPVPQTHSGSGPVHGGNPGQQVIINDIQAVFGPYAAGALNIARCESGYDPNAWNATPILGSHASGVFQILYPVTWNSTSYAKYSPYDAWANVRAAYEIFKRDGDSWREWACTPY